MLLLQKYQASLNSLRRRQKIANNIKNVED